MQKGTNAHWRFAFLFCCMFFTLPYMNAQCEVEGGTISTMDDTIICVDGNPDPINVMVMGASGTNSGWIITDDANNILAQPMAPPFDLDGAGEGICIIWYISYENDLMGNMMGNNLSQLTGCFDLSNGITVTREAPDGGTLTLSDGSTSYANCAGDIVFDVMHTTTAPNLSYWYIITDNNDNILAAHNTENGNTLDLSAAPPGECRIWGWSYMGTPAPVMGENISTLGDDDCEDISDSFIPIYREVPDGGTLTLTDGSTSYANCAGDIVFDVMHTTTAPNLSYWYIITDNNDNILAAHNTENGNTLDLSAAPPGECRIWGWSYMGTPAPVMGENISTLGDDDCEDISDSFIPIYREVPDGGTLTLTDGSITYNSCAGDVVFDVVHTTTAPNLSYWYIITDDNDNILAAHNTENGNTLDLSAAPPGVCRVWGWNYKGTPDPVIGENISTLEDDACEAVSDGFIEVIRTDCTVCSPVSNIQHNLMAPASIHITWDGLPNHQRWDIHYRKQGESSWTRIGALNPSKTLRFLEANTVYEYRVRPFCGTWDFSLASPIRRFNTANIPTAPAARVAQLNDEAFRLSPNPARDILNVEFNAQSTSDVNISIMDMNGRTIRQITAQGSEYGQTENINVSGLNDGYYLVVIQTEHDRLVKKFVKVQ